MKNTATTLTRHYFDLSNQRKLTEIARLFQSDATYSSDHTGLYFGVADIMQMMTSFFHNHTFLEWQINQLKQVSTTIIEVNFTLSKGQNNEAMLVVSGIERLVVVDGLIRHIEVR